MARPSVAGASSSGDTGNFGRDMDDLLPMSAPTPPSVIAVAMDPLQQGDDPAVAVLAADVARSLGASTVTLLTRADQGGETRVVDKSCDSRLDVSVNVEAAGPEWPTALARLLCAADERNPVVVADLDTMIAPAFGLAMVAAGTTSVVTVSAHDVAIVGAIAGLPVAVDRGFIDGPLHDADRSTLALSWSLIAARDIRVVADELVALADGDYCHACEVVVPSVLHAGVQLRSVAPRRHLVGTATDPQSAIELSARLTAVNSVDDRIDSAVKATDGPFTTYCVSPYSRHWAAFGARRGWSPNGVTAISLVLGLAAAGFLTSGEPTARVIGAFLLLVSFVFDCVDGQLARMTLRFSSFGSWFDLFSDRVKEFAMVAALAIGAGSTTGSWVLAGLSVGALSVRHAGNVSFTLNETPALRARRTRVDETAARRVVRAASPATEPARRRRGVRYWTPWLLKFTIGDRLAVVAVAVVLAGQRVALVVLAVGSVMAMTSQIAIRLRRMRTFESVPFMPDASALAMCDIGVVAPIAARVPGLDRWADRLGSGLLSLLLSAVGALCAWSIWVGSLSLIVVSVAGLTGAVALATRAGGGRWWLVATATRFADVAILLAVTGSSGRPWLGVTALMLVALRHSDLTFRSPDSGSGSMVAAGSAGGLALRTVVLAGAVIVDRPDVGLVVIAAVVAAQTLIEVIAQIRSM
jgi:phosphatidylglycerophosphate synthase